MELRALRTFVAVVEHGTVSGAAEHLHIAQPALSRQIGGLEEELGVRLFHRVRRRLVLTAEGEQLLGECRAVLGAVHTLGERAQHLRGGESGVLKVGATPQTIDGIFSSFLHRYAEHRPKVQIRLTEAVGAELASLLERGAVHLTVSLVQPRQVDSPFIDRFDLTSLEFLAASRERLEGAAGGDLEIGRLAAYPLLLLERSFYVRQTFDAACRLAAVEPSIFMESRTPHALLALAEAGHGVAVVPSVLPTKRYRLRLARITHRRKPLTEPYAVLWDKRRGIPPYGRDFCDLLAAQMRLNAVTLKTKLRPPARQ